MKLSKFLSFAGFTCITILLFGVATVFAKNNGVISSGTNVNVRTEPTVSSTVIKTVPKGTQLEILETAGTFYKVNVTGTTGSYISCDFITITVADGKINAPSVNIRSYPSLDGQILGKANSSNTFEVTGIFDEWYAVKYNSGTAYIHKDFLTGAFLQYVPKISTVQQATTATPTPQVTQTSSPPPQANTAEQATGQVDYVIITSETGLNFRVGPSQADAIICVIPSGAAAELLDGQGDWYKIIYNEREGYIFSDYAEKKSGVMPSSIKEPIIPENAAAPSAKAQEIIDYAKRFLGTPYVYGGTDLNRGVDCSGFTYSVFKHFGINLNRTSRDQINNGTKVERSALQMGDLIFFNTGGNTSISHVGIYIGDNQFIHSGSSRNIGVIISSLSTDYYNRMYYGACRVLR